jgi:hypothetical protein
LGAGERQRTVVPQLANRVGVPLNDEISLLCAWVVEDRSNRVDRLTRFRVEVCASKRKKDVRKSNDNASIGFLNVKLLFT